MSRVSVTFLPLLQLRKQSCISSCSATKQEYIPKFKYLRWIKTNSVNDAESSDKQSDYHNENIFCYQMEFENLSGSNYKSQIVPGPLPQTHLANYIVMNGSPALQNRPK